MKFIKSKAILHVLLSCTLVLGQLATTVAYATPSPEGTTESVSVGVDPMKLEYQVYPLPREITYQNEGFELAGKINVMLGTDIDDSTKQKIEAVLSEVKGLEVSFSDAEVEGSINLKVGVNGSSDSADLELTGANKLMDVDSGGVLYNDINIFETNEAYDSYILKVDNNTITILGEHTDAAYYGVTTLSHIINEMKDSNVTKIRNMTIRDYASVTYRGFIEGYYGVPWSHEDRMELMRYGSQFKMNAYIFAPKDDPYHNSQWREPYPEDKLIEQGELAKVGQETKNTYIWSIHPFMTDAFNFNNYDAELATIFTKFEQLYGVGVRQFAVLADDATGVGEANTEKIIADIDAWIKAKGDVKPLIYVSHNYTSQWGDKTFLKNVINELPQDLEILWTGQQTCGYATAGGANDFTNIVYPGGQVEILDKRNL